MATHASRDAVTTVQREDPELRFAVDQAIASARLEGIELRPCVLAAAERLVRGEISIDELIEASIRSANGDSAPFEALLHIISTPLDC